MAATDGGKHFVLIHGACHGAWSWHKLKPLLESAGHHVTALDLAASGINMKAIQEVHTLCESTQPLLDLIASLSPNERVILVGHSHGGLSLALAMDKFPENVSVAVFVSGFLPDTIHQPSYVVDQYFQRVPQDIWLDSKVVSYGNSTEQVLSVGHKCLSSSVYQKSPIEALELAKTLARPAKLFREDLSKANNFSDEKYGSVPRVYVVCDEDKLMPAYFQQWMIENCGVSEAIRIRGSDHMPMFSKPQELCDSLVKIAQKYA